MEDFEPWIWFGAVLWSIVVTAVVLYGTLDSHIGELHDEVRRLRADIGVSSSRTSATSRDGCRRCGADAEDAGGVGRAGTPAARLPAATLRGLLQQRAPVEPDRRWPGTGVRRPVSRVDGCIGSRRPGHGAGDIRRPAFDGGRQIGNDTARERTQAMDIFHIGSQVGFKHRDHHVPLCGPEPSDRPGPQGHSPSGETEALRPAAVMLGPAGEPLSVRAQAADRRPWFRSAGSRGARRAVAGPPGYIDGGPESGPPCAGLRSASNRAANSRFRPLRDGLIAAR